jgi:hypothetical protein
MRRALGVILALVGVVLLISAAALRFVVAPSVIKAPVAEDGRPFRSTTVATGGGSLLDQQTNEFLGDLALRAEISIAADVSHSTDDVAVWDVRTVVKNSTNNTELRTTTDRVAFDRTTSEAVIGYDKTVDDKHGVERAGTISYKFPFGAKKTTYDYFDTETGKGWPARYKGTTQVNGLQAYRYEQVIEPTVVDENVLPFLNFAGLDFERLYSTTRQFLVEPTTGIIVRAEEEMKQSLRFGGTGFETPALTASLSFDDDTVNARVNEAKQAKQTIHAIQATWPLPAAGAGVVLVVLGSALAFRRSKQQQELEVATL